MTNRYEVKVEVTYRINAESIQDAYRVINDGAEFPIVPWDDDNYVDNVAIKHISELSKETNEEGQMGQAKLDEAAGTTRL